MYKLVNIKTGQEVICQKIQIENFDYYVSDKEIKVGDWYTWDGNKNNAPSLCTDTYNESSILDSRGFTKFYKVISTNNPNIDIAQIVDDVEDLDILKSKWYDNQEEDRSEAFVFQYSRIVDDALEKGIIIGYNKSQETHPFSEENIVEFGDWIRNNPYVWNYPDKLKDRRTTKELLQLWKEQQPKIVYYNE